MQRLSIRHETTYRYPQPVAFGPQRLLMRPVDTHATRLIEAVLAFTPSGETNWAYDAYGNSICTFQPIGESAELTVVNTLLLDRFPAALDTQRYDPRSSLPIMYGPRDRVVLEPFMLPAVENASDEFLAWVRAQVDASEPAALPFLKGLNAAIHREFAYNAREVVGTQEPSVTLDSRSGTCRDFAWLMIEAVRHVGFAARFATGYLYSPQSSLIGGENVGAGATHAWCEVFLPNLGWVEFDPTNDLAESNDLIRVAITRTPQEAYPMSGTVIGDVVGDLTVSVDVRRVDAMEAIF